MSVLMLAKGCNQNVSWEVKSERAAALIQAGIIMYTLVISTSIL